MALEYVTNPEETHVLRGETIIADIVDGKIKMRAEHRKYAIGAGKFWKAFKGAQAIDDTPTPLGYHYAGQPGLHIPSPQDTVTERGYVRDVAVEAFNVAAHAFEVDAAIPPAPPMDPLLGSKTPAYAEWMKQYQPAQWAKLHKNWANR